MYLSPGVAPPTYTPPPSPRSYPQRHRWSGATLSLSFLPQPHAATILLPSFRSPSFFVLSRSFKLLRASPSPTHLYATTMCKHPRTSLHAAFAFPCVLTHVYFPSLSSPSSSTPSCARRCSPLRPPATDAYQRRDIQTPSNRRVASRRVASRPFFVLSDFSISILFSRIRRNITARC